MRKTLLWQTISALLAVLLVVSIYTGGFQIFKTNGATSTGTVNIVEFSDFQCPYCGRTVPVIKEILETYGNQVEFEFKQFPLNFHPHAQKAAEASECARDQGKFMEYHYKLYDNQGSLEVNSLRKYAADLGLDQGKFNECLDSGSKAEKVSSDFNEGQQLGVQGTPTFFINGEKLVGAQPFANFKRVIDSELAK